MTTWDLYRGGELLAPNVGTAELMEKVKKLLELAGCVNDEPPLVIRPGGSPVIGRVERVEDTFRCPACTLAVHVGDVFVTGNDGRRVCSVFCQRRLTKHG
jgi:hypothetical protein